MEAGGGESVVDKHLKAEAWYDSEERKPEIKI